jgi:hypothetical protein
MKPIFKYLLIIGLIFSTSTAFAQYENTSGQKKSSEQPTKVRNKVSPLSKIFIGGNIGGGWSSNSAFLELSPIVGYQITPMFHVGTRFTYSYSKYTYYGVKQDYHDFGLSVFTRYHFLKFLFVHAEFEELSAQYYMTDGQKSRKWVPGLFLGGGLYQHMGNTFMHIAILYNVLESEYSPYSNPIIRIGFGVAL